MADRIGQQLGNYRLYEDLGEGGFAKVYLGKHVYLGTLAAVKVLHTNLTNEHEHMEDFHKEAQLVASLIHPHIIQVLDFGIENETPFLIMDYAPGRSLRQHHPKGTRLSLTTILSYLKPLTSALQYAHNKGLVHRDVKPGNMLLGADDQTFLSDFGISTITNTLLQRRQDSSGTITYMSPEQIQGAPRRASDQYALGIVVYEWLSGSPPFRGTWIEIATQHQVTSPPPLREKIPNILPEVERVVLKALAKTPQERFESVLEFFEALENASVLPNESYYPLHVTLAIRTCYHEWGNGLGIPKDIGPNDANVHTSPQKTSGYKRSFANGAIYWSERGGAQQTWWGFSTIHEHLQGAEGILGFPLTPELPVEPSPQGTKGVYQRFEGQWNYPDDINTNPVERCGESLYYSEQHGSHPTYGGIGICYERQWGTAGALGFPTSDEIDAGPSPHTTTGKCQHFEGGSIYWSWQTEAHTVQGEIAKLYDHLSGVTGRLGFPLSGEKPTTNPSPQGTTGTCQRFEGGLHDGLPIGDERGDEWDYSKGVPVYSSKHGVYPVWGGIRRCYESLGNTSSVLGFPTSLEMEAAKSPQGTTGWYQYFEGGIIFWSYNYGGVPVTGSILVPYNEFGGTEGRFGFPKSPQKSAERHRHMLLQEFEGGLVCVLYEGGEEHLGDTLV